MNVLLLTLTTGLVWASAPAKTAAQIKQAIISRSIADYWGSCPCETSLQVASLACAKALNL